MSSQVYTVRMRQYYSLGHDLFINSSTLLDDTFMECTLIRSKDLMLQGRSRPATYAWLVIVVAQMCSCRWLEF